MNESTEITAKDEKKQLIESNVKSSEIALLEVKERVFELAKNKFALDQRVGQALCNSMLFPKDLRGDLGSAMIISELSDRMDVSPLELAQNIYLIHGKPSFSSKYMTARLNSSGCIIGTLDVVMSDDKQSCYCKAVDSVSGAGKVGMTVTMEMAKAEGWSTKSGSKWKTMPELMLAYRAQSFFINTHYPQVTFGMRTKEDLEDTEIIDATFENVDPVREVAEKANTLDIEAITQQAEKVETEKTKEEPKEVKKGENGFVNPKATGEDEHGEYNEHGEYFEDSSEQQELFSTTEDPNEF